MNMQAKRLLFIVNGSTRADWAESLMLAEWARAAGCDCCIAGNGRLADAFAAHALPTVPWVAGSEAGENAGEAFSQAQALAEAVRLQELQPELVVAPPIASLTAACLMLNLPLLTLTHAWWSSAAAMLPSFSRTGRLPFEFRRIFKPTDTCAYLDLPDMVPLRHRLPEQHLFLGPIVHEAPRVVALESAGLGLRRPLAYVSLEHAGDLVLTKRCLAELHALGCDTVVNGVEPDDELRVAINHGRSMCQRVMNPALVLERASFTVCHGDTATLNQSLAKGVPVLALPTTAEQHLAASAVATKGAAMVLEQPRWSAKGFQAAAKRLRDGTGAVSARELAKRMRQHDTRQAWLHYLADQDWDVATVIEDDAPTPLAAPLPFIRSLQAVG